MPDRAVFLFDGDCAFCTSCAEFITSRMAPVAEVRAWQFTDIRALGLTVADCDAAVQWVRPGEPVRSGPDAIARLLRDCSGAYGFWKLAGRVLGLAPVRWLSRPAYRWVARNRARLPGGTPACALPQAQRDQLGRS